MLPMKLLTHFLIALTIWSQFDDALLLPESTVVSTQLTGSEDNEFLPAKRADHEERVVAHRWAEAVCPNPQAAAVSYSQCGETSAETVTTAFAPPPLYMFMSLQN
jgi:hypothetical protein